MRNLFEIDEWKIVERTFDPNKQKQAESIFSIGNGSFGQRANFEEDFSGSTLQGSYVGGVYYPDKTRVGWWKNGYPEYFAKVLNSCNWIGIQIEIEGEILDLNQVQLDEFNRELDMQNGTLTRRAKVTLKNGRQVEIESIRFISMNQTDVAAIAYSLTPLNFSGKVNFKPYLDNRVSNHDANYDEFFWEEVLQQAAPFQGHVVAKTKKTNFLVTTAMRYTFSENGSVQNIQPSHKSESLYVENSFEAALTQGNKYTLHKYISVTSSLSYAENGVVDKAIQQVNEAFHSGFENLWSAHKAAWAKIWENADIKIEGDVEAQQGIRFNIFHLYQTYTGENAKLNIGPKGFTGEKYGGATYWDTEAYCIPFYLKTADPKVARQLLMYRYNQLDRAIENAGKLGFTNGAALYPMVTMNGEECHNEWEITFEEIHRNGAIAFAIYNYVRHTGDVDYLKSYGRAVVNGIARFWAQRFNHSNEKQAYVMLGVTGPNEYENNVNNNWYTNYIARWCLLYAIELEKDWASSTQPLLSSAEMENFQQIANHVYFPQLKDTRVFLQQDGFMDKELLNAADLPKSQRPINQHWSWDRILRSVFIKQADVLQGIYLFEDHFDLETIQENFDFYEPKTVHESSLSPCVHAIIAAKIGKIDKAYEMYLRTSRLDLDDYNHEADEGLHITSMAGIWMSVVEGFAGVRVHNGELHVEPTIPTDWNSYSFKIRIQNKVVSIYVSQEGFKIENLSDAEVTYLHQSKPHILPAKEASEVS